MDAAQAVAVGIEVPFRFHPRVPAGFSVKLLLGEDSVQARVLDVSMGGLQVSTALTDVPERVMVAIPLLGGDVVTEARVLRRTRLGLALALDRLGWDDFIELARYVAPRL